MEAKTLGSTLIAAGLLWTAALSAAQAVTFDQISQRANVDDLVDDWNDCWGYIDPATGIEYALIGNSGGTAIYNLQDPYNPRRTGVIAGPPSVWRDIKVYRTDAFVTTEGGGELGGLQVIDLSDPENPALVHTDVSVFLSAHNLFVDTVSARAYICGANNGGGGLQIIDISTPTSPSYLGTYSDAYFHDVYVRDNVAYGAALNLGKLMLLDVTDPADIDTIGMVSYPQASTHAAWPTEDAQYVLTADERTNGHIRVWDISDPQNIIQVDSYNANPGASVHNVTVMGDQAYISYYTEGLRVLDVSQPTNVTEMGYFDEHPGGGLFAGDWGVFPFFPSRTTLISDFSSGGWLVALDWEKGKISGTVEDAGSLAPIPGATVRVAETGFTATADASGEYLLSLDAGNYTLIAKAFGFADSVSTNVTATPGAAQSVDLDLTALATATVTGTILDAGTTNPLAGLWVELAGTGLGDSTDASGVFSIPDVPEGSHTLRIDNLDWIPIADPLTVPAGGLLVENRSLEAVFYVNDFEDSLGWSSWSPGDDATGGTWQIANPRHTGGGFIVPDQDHTSGKLVLDRRCWLTAQTQLPGENPATHDVDGWKTTLTSPTFDLSATADPTVRFFYWYVNDAGFAPQTDTWRVDVSSNGGADWRNLVSTTASAPEWIEVRERLAAHIIPTSDVVFRFVAEDTGEESIVEALMDDFQIWGGTATSIAGPGLDSVAGAPRRAALHQNTPNPWKPSTTIAFDLPRAGRARLRVYSPEGRLVANLLDESLPAGTHHATWNGRDLRGAPLASGVYFYRLEAGGETLSRRMLLLK